MNPQLSPNQLYAYELLTSSSEDDHDNYEDPYENPEGDRYFQRLIDYLEVDGSDFESMWDIYIRNRPVRYGVIGEPRRELGGDGGADSWSYDDDGDFVMEIK